MNLRFTMLNLIREIDKFVTFNILLILLIVHILFLLKGYSKKEIFLIFFSSASVAIPLSFTTLKLLKKKINSLFEEIEFHIYFDELTSVYNRTAGMGRLKEEIARAKRNGSPLTIAMADIDSFKLINDSLGHLAGDKVLATVASHIRNHLRVNDIVIRYGGEEFLIVLPDTDEISAYIALERVRESLEKQYIRIGEEKVIQVTLSIGIYEIDLSDEIDLAIQKADMALYQAKRNGKNRIEIVNRLLPNPKLS